MKETPEGNKYVIAGNISNERRRISLALCAREFGVSPEQWCRWEQGEDMPDAQTISRLADFFGINKEKLLRLHYKTGEENFQIDVSDLSQIYCLNQDNQPLAVKKIILQGK